MQRVIFPWTREAINYFVYHTQVEIFPWAQEIIKYLVYHMEVEDYSQLGYADPPAPQKWPYLHEKCPLF